MKPPARSRRLPVRIRDVPEEEPPPPPPHAAKAACRWHRAEKHKLLKALKKLKKTAESQRDVDCSLLDTEIPGRTPEEIRCVVELLKKRVVSGAARCLSRSRKAEQSCSRPIQRWTQLAAALTGLHREVVTSSLSQILLVSSTEPCTLKNSAPPTEPRPAGRQGPPPAGGPRPAGTAIPPLGAQTPPPTLGAVVGVPISPAAAACAGLSSPRRLESPASAPRPSTTPKTAMTLPASSSSPPTAPHKSSTREASTTLRPADVVDFERIYCYLSQTLESSQAPPLSPVEGSWPLSPMESAVVLDLLTSLPEELLLLDCNKLHRHFRQVFHCVSAPADSRKARQTFGDVRAEPVRQQAAAPPHGEHTASLQPCEPGSQSEDRVDVPPLNPFLVPVELLQRLPEQAHDRHSL